jgi:hypothetical protein
VGIFSFDAGNVFALDVDKDGKEELCICIDQNFIIIKFNGSAGHHSYEVYYIKQNELSLAGINSVYYGTSMFDITNDGKEEILISLDQIIDLPGDDQIRTFTYIYKPDKTSGIINTSENIPNEIDVFQNYPNPFNPRTTITYQVPEISFVTLKIYDVLGNRIATLINEEKPAGSYEVEFDASSLSSGIYFYKLQSGSFVETKKMVLLK